MTEFYGKVNIGQVFSFLETQSFPSPISKYWLLFEYNGADLKTAGLKATSYIQGTKHIASGSPVIVTGELVTLMGSQPAINMSDINLANIVMAHAHFGLAAEEPQKLQKTPGARKRAGKSSPPKEKK